MIEYQRRADGLIAVTIDSNVWNLFHDLHLCLAKELPSDRFRLFIPREVEIEIDAIAAASEKKPDLLRLKEYIADQIEGANIATTAVFGFARQSPGPERRGGFGFGTFQSESQRKFYCLVQKPYLVGKPTIGSELTRNEADAALGAASFSSVVLTLDEKAGPLRVAHNHGGKVLYMKQFSSSQTSLADYVVAHYEATQDCGNHSGGSDRH